MASRIIRHLPEDTEKFVLKEFSASVERGEQKFNIRSFAADEEVSVQESRLSNVETEDPEAVEDRTDEVTDDDYLPPSKLVKAGSGVVGEAVRMPAPDGAEFVESGVFSDAEESQSEYPTKILRQEEMNASYEEKIAKLSEEKTALEIKLSEQAAIIQGKDKELEELNAALPGRLEVAKEEGRTEGIKEGEEQSRKVYIAQKEDYLANIDTFNKEALGKLNEIDNTIKSIDDEMGKTVIGFVKSIIGVERKINDTFVIQLIKANLNRLRDLKIIKFVANPDDLGVMKSAFADYTIETDVSVPKGAIKIISKAGEVDLDSSSMIADLEKQINETIGTPLKS